MLRPRVGELATLQKFEISEVTDHEVKIIIPGRASGIWVNNNVIQALAPPPKRVCVGDTVWIDGIRLNNVVLHIHNGKWATIQRLLYPDDAPIIVEYKRLACVG